MPTIKEKYQKYRPKKFLGQNFLTDENIAKKIVESIKAGNDDIVIEIGPGQGILTKYLFRITKDFTAVELDKSICIKLKDKFKDDLNIIHQDFLKFDLFKFSESQKEVRKIKIIGNIPYNITSEILFKLFEGGNRIDTAVLMMQKEVAQRLQAKPNTKEYGILAVQTQVNANPKILFNVSPSSFFPKPNVESSVVKLDFDSKKYQIKDRELFRNFIRSSFSQRRKTLNNSLKLFFEKVNLSDMKPEFDYSRRAENVSIEEYVKLSNEISDILGENIN